MRASIVAIAPLAVIALAALLHGRPSAADATALSTLPVSDAAFTERFIDEHRQDRIELHLAAGEGEAALLTLRPGADGAFRIAVDGAGDGGVALEAYRLDWVSVERRLGGALRKLDPMVPLRLGAVQYCPQRRCLLWLRFVAAGDSDPGVVALTLRVRSGSAVDRIPVRLRVAPISIAPVAPLGLQAALARNPGAASGDAAVLASYRLLGRFKINTAAANPRLLDCVDCFYPKLFAAGSVRGARLMFPHAERFFQRRGASAASVAAFTARLDRLLDDKRALIERFPDRFHIKMWDEPEPHELRLVKSLYRYVAAKRLPLGLEIAGAGERGAVPADIDVVRLRELGIDRATATGAAEPEAGSPFWIYANAMHSLRRPYPTMRNIGWLLWLLNARGYHFWDVANSRGDPRGRTLGHKDYLGRGLFLYPNADGDAFIPSLRLAMFREGIEDYQLLRALGSRQSAALRAAAARLFALRSGRRVYAVDAATLRPALLRAVY